MGIKNRINRVIKEQKKAMRKAYTKRMGVLAQTPPYKEEKKVKGRQLDGTMLKLYAR
jgi:hypothetical protein